MIFLGLDISTNCTGYSLIDEAEKIVDIGFLDTSKEDNWIKKAIKFREFIDGYREDIQNIAIEDILSKFSGGMSTSKTIISLARFNGLATFFCYEKYKIIPEHINVRRARNLAGIKVPKGTQSKEFVLNSMTNRYNLDWPQMKNKDSIAKQAYDMADGLVIAIALKRMQDENNI